jgi:penicillin amidase
MVPRKDDITEYMDFSKNPSAVKNGTLYIQLTIRLKQLMAFYILVIIFQRLKNSLLEPKSDWTKESVGKMLNDNTSLVAPIVVKNLISGLEASSLSKRKEAVSILNSWKGTNNTGDVGPTIYNKLIYMYLKNTYKELGEEGFTQF